MDKRIPMQQGEVILSKDYSGFMDVVNDFPHANFVYIITFNISKESDILLNKLKEIQPHTPVKIVTNIPGRWAEYTSVNAAKRANDSIKKYCEILDKERFKSDVTSYFNFSNHAKIIMTDNVAYIGSANYSDESRKNFECGTLFTDKNIINRIKEIADEIINHSVRYSTSYHNVVKEYLRTIVGEVRESLRHLEDNIFKLEEERYGNEKRTIDVYNAVITQSKWETFTGFYDVLAAHIEGIYSTLESEIEDEYVKQQLEEDPEDEEELEDPDNEEEPEDLEDYIERKLPEYINKDVIDNNLEQIHQSIEDLKSILGELASYDRDYTVTRFFREYDYGETDEVMEKALRLEAEVHEQITEKLIDDQKNIEEALEVISSSIDIIEKEINLVQGLSDISVTENRGIIENTHKIKKY